MKYAALAAALAACAVPSIAQQNLTWVPLGEPGCGGDITAVRVNPYNTSQAFIAGDMLGVGVSLDGGNTWLAPAPNSFLSWEHADFSFDPVLKRIYVASLSGPYYANFSDPLTWASLRNGFPSLSAHYGTYTGTTQKILIDPTSNGQRLVAIGGNKRGWVRVGGNGIIWESLDAGASWNNITNLDNGNIVNADWCGDQCIWAAASGAGMYRSMDGGRTWTKLSTGLNNDYSFGFSAAHPTDPDTAYVAMCDGSGIFKTSNGGQSWAPINSGIQTGNGCYEAFGMAPTDPNTLYAGNGNQQSNMWVTKDGGNTWNKSGSPPSAQAYGLGLGASFLSVHPTDANTVLYGTWVTLWVTKDGGATFTDATAIQPPSVNDTTGTIWRGTGFSGLVSTNIDFNPYSQPFPNRAFVQGMDAGKIWRAVDADLYAWQRQTGLNEFGGGNAVTFGADGNTVYAGTGQFGWPSYYSSEGVELSTDGGEHFAYSCGRPNITGDSSAWSLHTVPTNTSNLWSVFQDSRVYFSSNGCANWTLVPAVNDTIYFLTAIPTSSPDPAQTVMFAAGRLGVWVTGPGWTNGLHQWTLLNGGPQAWDYSINWCGLSNVDSNKLVCANGWWDQWHSGLWTLNMTQAQAYLKTGSGNNGWNWIIKDTTMYRWTDAKICGVEVQAYASNLNPYPEQSFANGVFVSVDGGNTWVVMNDGLRMKRVAALKFTPDGKKLIAGLNGGGFYVADATVLVPGCSA